MSRQPTLHELIHKRLTQAAGLDSTYGRLRGVSLAQVKRTFAAEDFHKRSDDKFVVGAFRYGLITGQIKNGNSFDHIESIRKRLKYYDETGDMDVLPDIANLAKAEWIHPHHENAHLDEDWDKHDYDAPGRME